MTNWKEYYQSKLMTHEEAVSKLQDNWFIFMGVGHTTNSEKMYEALIEHAIKNLKGFILGESITMRYHRMWDLDFNIKHFESIKGSTGFALPGPPRVLAGSGLRDLICAQAYDSHVYLAPIADSYCAMVTPPNKDGYVNLSLCNFVHQTAIREGRKHGKLKYVMAEVNDKLPVVYGDNWMHVTEFDAFVEHSIDLPIYKAGDIQATPEELSIADYVSQYINDRDCIQIGIGTIPEAVSKNLGNRQGLGLHTEAFVNGHLDMINKGIVDNKHKNLWKGMSVSSFVIGDENLLEFCRENPSFNMMPGSIVADPRVIAQVDNIRAINNIIMIDLTGQSTCETIGHRQVSGLGGQFNFQQGARWSKGGRAFSLLYACRTLPSGEKVSAIVPELPPGTTTGIIRHYTDLVVSEFGVADMTGKLGRARAEALIEIAHPDFRGELRKAAFRYFYPAGYHE